MPKPFLLVSSQVTFMLLTFTSDNVTIRDLLVVFLRHAGSRNQILRRLEDAFLPKYTKRDIAP